MCQLWGNLVVSPPPRRSSVAEDSDFQSLLTLVLSEVEGLKVLISGDRSRSGPVPVSIAVVEGSAWKNSLLSVPIACEFCHILHCQ